MSTQFGAVSGTDVTRCSFRHHLNQNSFFRFPFLLSDCLIWPEKIQQGTTSQKGNDLKSIQCRNEISYSKFSFMHKKHTAQSNKNNVQHYWIQSIFVGQIQTKLVKIWKMSTAAGKHRTVRLENVSLTSANLKMSFRIWHRSNKPHRRAKSHCYIQHEVVNHINIYIHILFSTP